MNSRRLPAILRSLGAALGVSCGNEASTPSLSHSDPSTALEDRVQPPESIEGVGKVVSTVSGYDPKVIPSELGLLTHFDFQLENGLYVALTPGFHYDTPEYNSFMDGAYLVRGSLRKDASGKPIIIPSIDNIRPNLPLYDLRSIKSTLVFPDRFEIERGGDRGTTALYGAKIKEALQIPCGNARLLVHLSEPDTWVSVSSPSAPWNGGFRLVAEKTDAVDKVGKPIYREVSLTPLPSREVYSFKR